MEQYKHNFEYCYFTGRKDNYLPIHRIDHRKFFFCVLVYVRCGEYHTTVEGHTYTARAGEALFIPPGIIHDVFMTAPGRLDWMHFSCTVGGMEVFGGMPLPVVLAGDTAAWGGKASAILAEQSQQPFSVHNSLVQDATLAAFAAHLVERFAISFRPPSELISQTLSLIQRNLRADLRLQDLAASLNISPSTLERRFQNEMGMSLFDYIRKQRIELACTGMLRTGSVGSAAAEAGYCDIYYFSRAFKKYMGITPRQYLECTRNRGHKSE